MGLLSVGDVQVAFHDLCEAERVGVPAGMQKVWDNVHAAVLHEDPSLRDEFQRIRDSFGMGDLLTGNEANKWRHVQYSLHIACASVRPYVLTKIQQFHAATAAHVSGLGCDPTVPSCSCATLLDMSPGSGVVLPAGCVVGIGGAHHIGCRCEVWKGALLHVLVSGGGAAPGFTWLNSDPRLWSSDALQLARLLLPPHKQIDLVVSVDALDPAGLLELLVKLPNVPADLCQLSVKVLQVRNKAGAGAHAPMYMAGAPAAASALQDITAFLQHGELAHLTASAVEQLRAGHSDVFGIEAKANFEAKFPLHRFQ